jgi:salicylate hydroxylase
MSPIAFQSSLYPRTTTLPIHIVIVGGGVGGLAAGYCLGQAGHIVTILEAAEELSEVGAGVQITPNATRLLIRWGLGEKLKQTAVCPQAVCFRRCKLRLVAYCF